MLSVTYSKLCKPTCGKYRLQICLIFSKLLFKKKAPHGFVSKNIFLRLAMKLKKKVCQDLELRNEGQVEWKLFCGIRYYNYLLKPRFIFYQIIETKAIS